jgi:hypothetical protein
MQQYLRRPNAVTGMLAARWENSQTVRAAERRPGDLRLLNRRQR